jgi:hypothetical protein
MLTAENKVRINEASIGLIPLLVAIGIIQIKITACPTQPRKWIELIFQ